jgi:hypothetical protein
VHSLTNFEYYSAFLFITKILGFALLIVVQLRLLSGIGLNSSIGCRRPCGCGQGRRAN